MTRYWWVNHKKTVKQEIGGGYLWSPKAEKRARSQFYDNMREAAPGDRVISYASGKISYIGTVADYAEGAPKPSEFGKAGKDWSESGWLLPVAWQAVPAPLQPKNVWSEVDPLLPSGRYSPLSKKTRGGSQKAYFSEIGQPLFELIESKTLYDTSAPVIPACEISETVEALEDAIQSAIAKNKTLDDTVKKQLIEARKGQGAFRKNVAKIEKFCRLTGIKNPALLRASHIKPWRSCKTAEERLDGANGLLLTPDVDHLFDRGLITFEDDGSLLISPVMTLDDIAKLGLTPDSCIAAAPFSPAQKNYLAHHRDVVFHKRVKPKAKTKKKRLRK